jgi:catechol 2,3-dioxygenase-like lactoylglutathione lyase family enzyme
MIRELVHTNLVVSDVERSVAFYTDMLGARVVRDWWGESETTAIAFGLGVKVAKWHAYMLRFGEGDDATFPQLDLLEWIEPKSVGSSLSVMNHIGIPRICAEVADVDQVYETLSARGVEFISPPVVFNPATERGRRTKAVCLKDPDGIVIELVGPLRSRRT